MSRDIVHTCLGVGRLELKRLLEGIWKWDLHRARRLPGLGRPAFRRFAGNRSALHDRLERRGRRVQGPTGATP